MNKYKNILIPVDFSASSIQQFEFGQSIAIQSHSVIHLLHVIDSFFYTENLQKEDEEIIKKARFRNTEEELQKFVFEIPRKDIRIVKAIAEGIPHEEILHYAYHNNIDLIVISTHGWTGLTDLLMGKTANNVMRNSDIPLICVKSNVPVISKGKMKRDYYGENWMG